MQTTETKVKTFGETTFNNNDLSFRHKNHSGENFFTRIFGTKDFIFTFWKLLLPSLIWGTITSLVPLLFNVFCAFNFNRGQGMSGNVYLAINYTYGVFSTFNALITVFLFAVFPVIGNFIARRHFESMRQTVRWAIYIGFFIAFVLMIFEQIFAKDMMNLMVWNNLQSGNQTTLSVNLLRFLSFIGFFYLWGWIYVPTLSSIKNTKVILESSFVAFKFFIIATPLYLHYVTNQITSKTTQDELNMITDHACYGLGAIYLVYFMIQPIYIYIYCRYIDTFRRIWYQLFKFFYDKHPNLKKVENLEKELLFMSSFKVSFELIKRIFKLSWGIIIDQLLYAIISIIQLVFIINYGGKLIQDEAFDLNGANAYAAAANYYKDITSIAFMLQLFLYGIFNSFTIAPQYFVANELGKGNKQQALHNEYLCLNWAIVMGIVFMICMFACSTTLNEFFFPSTSKYYFIYINNNSNSFVTYKQLYFDNNNIMFIFSGFMIINTLASMCFFVMIEGGCKYTAFGDSIVQILFTIISIILYFVHYDNMYWYYAISQIMLLVKVIIAYVIVMNKLALNSIEYAKLDDEVSDKNKVSLNKIVNVNTLLA